MSASPAETEKKIRERLEASGQMGKMRAMIVEAALQSLAAKEAPGEADGGSQQPPLFSRKEALTEAKRTEDGRLALGAVVEYLQHLGLQYTASVLRLEADLAVELQNPANLHQALHTPADDVALLALVRDRGRAAAPAVALPSPKKAPTPVRSRESSLSASPTRDVARGPAQPPAAGKSLGLGGSSHGSTPKSKSATSSSSSGSPEKDAADDDAQSDHAQPGGEDTTYFVSKWARRHFVRSGQVAGQQVQVEYLTDCEFVVLDPIDSMTVDDCEGGTLIVAACEGSVFLRNCKNMHVHVACKQLRTRDCEGVTLHIFTTTDPVVEMSHHMTFTPWSLRLPGLCAALAAARLDLRTNRFVHVYDFTKTEPGLPQPHFTVDYPPDPPLQLTDRAVRGYTGGAAPDAPPEFADLLAGRLLPAASSESGVNKSYDIKSGAAVWAAAGTAAAGAEDDSGDDDEDKESDKSSKSSSSSESSKKSSGSSKKSSSDGSKSSDSSVAEDAPAAPPPAVPSAGDGRPPTAKSGLGAVPGGLDDQEYSSFDESVESGDDDDSKYEVEEDDDEF